MLLTVVRFVKKPGMVIFTNNKTFYVTPDERVVEINRGDEAVEKKLFPKKQFDGDFMDFLDNVKNITVIISLGSCIKSSNKGKYCVLIYYKDKVKLLEDNIETNSANVCILKGMLAAVDQIKKPTHIYFVSGCPVGFHSPKGHNRNLCECIYANVVQKNCTAEIVEIPNQMESLKDYIKKRLLAYDYETYKHII